MIEAVGVVVPARDEELLLPGCLRAIEVAAAATPLPCRVVVVLDDCRDRSREQAEAFPNLTLVEVSERNVGRARGAGFSRVLQLFPELSPGQIWIATTDADSQVPPDWLLRQLSWAWDGAEAVVGTVRVRDWEGRADQVARDFLAGYEEKEGHHQVHGANLGCTAEAYLAAGGFPTVRVGEDVALVLALGDRRLVRTGRIPVVTSARRNSRARGGFGDYLDSLSG